MINGIKAMGLIGANFTIPHKQAVLKHLDELALSAKIIGAVNTISIEGGRLIGHNTDGQGFMRALEYFAKAKPQDSIVTILGAGGAARAIAVELSLAGAKSITIVNRTLSKAEQLIEDIAPHLKSSLSAASWDSTHKIPNSTDILINATSIGLYPDSAMPDVDMDTILPDMLVVDVIPNPPETKFLKMAEAAGANTLNGLGMLVHQGAIAFKIWTGKDAPVDVMYKALIDEFGAG